jgi:hypothetical protein
MHEDVKSVYKVLVGKLKQIDQSSTDISDF